jgi:cysteinyl-tRNA synthetase
LTVDGDKMSKSLGNFFTVRDLLAKAPGEAIRFALLTAQYRKPLDWTDARLQGAERTLNRYYNVLWQFQAESLVEGIGPPADFLAALEDDLNTPKAISVLDSMVGKFNEIDSSEKKSELKSQLLACGQILGIFNHDPEDWRKQRLHDVFPWIDKPSITVDEFSEVLKLIEQRNEARAAKNFAESDRIRDELAEQGIVLEDRPDGTTDWRRE